MILRVKLNHIEQPVSKRERDLLQEAFRRVAGDLKFNVYKVEFEASEE